VVIIEDIALTMKAFISHNFGSGARFQAFGRSGRIGNQCSRSTSFAAAAAAAAAERAGGVVVVVGVADFV